MAWWAPRSWRTSVECAEATTPTAKPSKTQSCGLLKSKDNMLVEDSAYEWAPKRWSYCSKACGGGMVKIRGENSSHILLPHYYMLQLSTFAFSLGKQYLRYGCRRKVDSKMVHKIFCNKSNMKPRGDMRDCNQKPCPPPMYV
ncbi:hypothetical protein XENOCAPTIV_020551 [Xenoophorus captivus]|uniref:Uncharacterized protein n=1 Tax=Xenoophorus captivus TaxID=1517983 RepID=A0ABV0QKB6_9TELE